MTELSQFVLDTKRALGKYDDEFNENFVNADAFGAVIGSMTFGTIAKQP